MVPFVAVAAANCINIPCMRMQWVDDERKLPSRYKIKTLFYRELRNGVVLLDENNNEVGVSKNAAFQGISAVVISRVAMAVPGMS